MSHKQTFQAATELIGVADDSEASGKILSAMSNAQCRKVLIAVLFMIGKRK